MNQNIDDIPGTSSIDSEIHVGKKFKFSRMCGKSLDTSLSYSKKPLEQMPESGIYSGTIHHFERPNHQLMLIGRIISTLEGMTKIKPSKTSELSPEFIEYLSSPTSQLPKSSASLVSRTISAPTKTEGLSFLGSESLHPPPSPPPHSLEAWNSMLQDEIDGDIDFFSDIAQKQGLVIPWENRNSIPLNETFINLGDLDHSHIKTTEGEQEKDTLFAIHWSRVYVQFIVEKTKSVFKSSELYRMDEVAKMILKFQDVLDNILHDIDMILAWIKCPGSKSFQSYFVFKSPLEKYFYDLALLCIPKKLQFYFEEILFISKEHIICSVLGINQELVTYLHEMEEDMMSHHSYEYYIGKFLARNEENLVSGNEEENFVTLGFNKAIASILAREWIAYVLQHHFSCVQWAMNYVEQMFRYDLLLQQYGLYSHEFCGLSQVLNELKTFESPFQVSKDGEKVPKEIKYINFNKETFENRGHNLLKAYDECKQDSDLRNVRTWFHGTDEFHAIEIALRGIKPNYAKPRLGDFSEGSGFNLSPCLDYAYEKAKKEFKPAIMVFDGINPNEFFLQHDSMGREIGKCFQSANDEWKQVVKKYRDGLVIADDDNIEIERMIKYIYGPISKGYNTELKKRQDIRRNIPEERRRPWAPEPAIYKPTNSLQYQLCIRDDQLASTFFQMSVVNIIFLK